MPRAVVKKNTTGLNANVSRPVVEINNPMAGVPSSVADDRNLSALLTPKAPFGVPIDDSSARQVAANQDDILDVPSEYQASTTPLGVIPADVAEGYFVTRVRDDDFSLAEARAMQRLPVKLRSRSKFNPDELVIKNAIMFPLNRNGYLTYKGDLLVVSDARVEAARLRANHIRALEAQYGKEPDGTIIPGATVHVSQSLPEQVSPELAAALKRDGFSIAPDSNLKE